MAKQKTSADFSAIVEKLSTKKELPRFEIKPEALNTIWNGFHLGSMYLMWAEAGAGKSTLAVQVVRSLLKQGLVGLYIDVEKALNEQQQETFKIKQFVDDGSLAVITCENFQQLEEVVISLPNSGINFVVIDSVSMVRAYTPIEMRIEDIRPGLKSMQESTVLNKLKDVCYYNKIGVILLAHARANIQISGPVNRYAPDTKMAGGFVMNHAPDVITQIQTHSKVKDDDGSILGVEISLQTTKCKWCSPYQPIREKLYFGKGIDPKLSIIEKAIELEVIKKEGRSYLLPGDDKKYNRKTVLNIPSEKVRELQAILKQIE